jgi:hypothetical protein
MMNSTDPMMNVESHVVSNLAVEDSLCGASFCFTLPGNVEAPE